MRIYSKAYQLRDVRKFAGWTELHQEGEEPLNDEDLCFIWNDFTVTKRGLSGDKNEEYIIYKTVTPEWQEFCKTTLVFEIPEDLRKLADEDSPPESDG